MNERIRELEMQVAESFDPLVYMPQREYAKEFNKRFAELIVQECASICRDRKLTPSVFTADELLEHFGVE